jgi:HSP20 family molecular chaperone IbpA
MHANIHRQNRNRFPVTEPKQAFRTPHYDCTEQSGAMRLVVYIPGVDASGVEITTLGPDLFLTARKTRHVRVNWQPLHLETAQRDYHLRLRLGSSVDYDALQAAIAQGVLTIVLPKSRLATAGPAAQRQVA